jgi:hypothetical protein
MKRRSLKRRGHQRLRSDNGEFLDRTFDSGHRKQWGHPSIEGSSYLERENNQL